MFKDLNELNWWLMTEALDAYCSKRWNDAEEDEDGCKGCQLEGCEDCPTAVIELARGLQWRDE